MNLEWRRSDRADQDDPSHTHDRIECEKGKGVVKEGGASKRCSRRARDPLELGRHLIHRTRAGLLSLPIFGPSLFLSSISFYLFRRSLRWETQSGNRSGLSPLGSLRHLDLAGSDTQQ
jgi:hypothetical protein